jgi:hypothetical protein
MLPMKAVRLDIGTLIAADAATLAPATNANKIALVTAPFTPTENLVATDLTYASFTGSTPIAGSTGAQQTGVDPNTGQQIVTIKEPLGGWRWVVGGSTGLPVTVYGFALLDSTLATLLAVEAFATPQALTETGQEINLGTAKLTVVLNPMA